MIYFVCYVVSAGFAYLANASRKKNMIIIWSILSIMVTVVLAGLRDYSIGIDTINYLNSKRFWVNALTAGSLTEYMRDYMTLGLGEPLFALLVGIVGQYWGEFRVFLFIVHLIIITCVYIGAYRHREYVNPALIIFLYYLYFYSHSLNISRQYVAMSILFAVTPDLYQGKWKRYCIVNVIAILFHTSAIMGVIPLVVYMVLYKEKKDYETTMFRKFLIISGSLLLVVSATSLLQIFIEQGFLASKYSYYIENETETNIVIPLFLTVELVFCFIYRKQMIQLKKKVSPIEFFIICSIIYFILLGLSNTIAYGKRIAQYCSCINVVTIAILTRIPRLSSNRKIIFCGVIALSILYWWYTYIYNNASQTYPYILGI